MKTLNLERFIPEYLAENDNYTVLVKLLNYVFDEYYDSISEFTTIVDVDNCNSKFLDKLSKLVGSDIVESLPYDDQRETIKRLIKSYKVRGTDENLEISATYGGYDHWVNGSLMIPGYKLDLNRAKITYPLYNVFRYNKSKYSGTDKYQDSWRFRSGTINIDQIFFNYELVDAVKRVTPAGTKVIWNIISEITNKIEIPKAVSDDPNFNHKLYYCLCYNNEEVLFKKVTKSFKVKEDSSGNILFNNKLYKLDDTSKSYYLESEVSPNSKYSFFDSIKLYYGTENPKNKNDEFLASEVESKGTLLTEFSRSKIMNYENKYDTIKSIITIK